ncbi:MAG: citrate transporter, partial [Proteobacteria bacterium]|nr:citrate transporter [Candidatus Fonsibacter lacus]
MLLGIPVEFYLFALILLFVALFHNHVLKTALIGLTVVTFYKIFFAGFKTGAGLNGFIIHLSHEWVIIINLLCLLVGFALLSNHFEKSNITDKISVILPEGWKGAFTLLAFVFFISSFLDNIAAAIIGATIASNLFNKKVHIGYLAAIVALFVSGYFAAKQQESYQSIIRSSHSGRSVDWGRIFIVFFILITAVVTNV